MTQQLSILEMAKQGDATAIAALINRSLQPKGIVAQASMEGECLRIVLLSAQLPNQKSVVDLIHRGMVILQVESVKQVRIAARRVDTKALIWESEFSLTPIESSLSIPPESTTTLLDPIKNQKGIILVQKLSQLNRNQQEYQDIIIRFIDDRVGTVRCLATLSELMQAINKSNFSFSSVATNPNLRHLLDTIAEYSSTDEKGDQIITNVSVLQPGQPWQKVKIRLVTQVYFEPAPDEEVPTPKQHSGITLDVNDTPITPPITPIAAAQSIEQSVNYRVVDLGIDANSKNQRGFTTVSDNVLDDLIQDLEPNRSNPESKQAIATNPISSPDSIGDREQSLTVGDFLNDFGFEEKVVPNSPNYLQSTPQAKPPSEALVNAQSQNNIVEVESERTTNRFIEPLFHEFEFADESSDEPLKVKASSPENAVSKTAKRESTPPSSPGRESEEKEMITLDSFW
ncbi:hypothetical protein TUMEXPCC7403_20015 [Tumidithrix helvetica PCC 7403]|uniref:hypothetical protein n=1 Tax=Tumidithrix helvetica TaxID=3457545 RepID=UPI003C8B2688